MSPIGQSSRSFFRRANRLRATLLAAVLLTAFVAIIGTSWSQMAAAKQATSTSLPDEVRTLAGGETLKRHMDAGAKHVYEVALAAQQFAQLIVEQKGIDVEVRAISPDRRLYILTDNPNGFYGRETVSIVAQISGIYRIEVFSNKAYPAGDYELKIEGPRLASASDEKRVIADRAFAEAQQLRGSAAKRLSRKESVKEYNSAIGKYNEALTIWRELGDLRGQGYALTNTGRIYKILREPTLAFEHLAQALSCLREAGDRSGQAFVLNETGALHRDFGNVRDSLTTYDDAVKLRLGLGDRYGQAQLYNNLALGYSNIGYQLQALENIEKAISIWGELGLRDSEMRSRINAAKAYVEMGDMDAALAQYQAVLSFSDAELSNENSTLKASARSLRPFALNGIGLVYDTWADSDAARDNYKKALDLFRENGENQREADVLDNLGMLHAFLGDASQARDYIQNALAIRQQVREPKPWGMTLSNLGYAYTLLGNNEEALKQLALAFEHSRNSGDKRFEAYTLIRTGIVHIALNEPRKALENYELALAIQQDPQFEDRRGLAITLDKMGEALILTGEWTQALKKYEQALASWTAVGDEQGRALSLYGIARVERDRQNLANARDRAEEAIRIVEKLRHRLTSRQLQMTYFAGKQDMYALAIDVRMRLSELAKPAAERDANMEAALSLSEHARARNLLDLLTQTSRLHLGAKENAANGERTLISQIRKQELAAKPLTPQEIQQLLDDNTLLLQYSLGDERSHLWTITRKAINHHFLRSRAEVEAMAKEFRNVLTAYEAKRPGESDKEYLARWRKASDPDEYRRIAVKLSRIVLGPVWSQLGNKRLVIVADGALQYVPFEALPASEAIIAGPRQLPILLSTNEIVYEPSASTLALLRATHRPSGSKTVAVIADPVFTKEGAGKVSAQGAADVSSPAGASRETLTRSLRDIGDIGESVTLPRLEYSRREADAITSVAPQGSWMKAVGFDASRAIATSPILKQFKIVHFATHGILNDKNPELSGIVLSMVNKRGQAQNGFLTLRDIYKLDLPVRLVVLSACQTGIGQLVRGEGLIGLTRGFMHAGARSVVVSLWRVDDKATAELMKRFYQHMLGKAGLPPAAALRQAQLEMQAHKDWHESYYWAGFILQGDWK